MLDSIKTYKAFKLKTTPSFDQLGQNTTTTMVGKKAVLQTVNFLKPLFIRAKENKIGKKLLINEWTKKQ